MILLDEVKLAEFMRQRRRLLAEEGAVVVPFPQLWMGSRNRLVKNRAPNTRLHLYAKPVPGFAPVSRNV